MTKYEEGRAKVKTLMGNFKRNTSKLRGKSGKVNDKVQYLKGVLDEVKTHIPKQKKSKKTSNNFMGNYGNYDPFGSPGKKKKGKKGYDPFSF